MSKTGQIEASAPIGARRPVAIGRRTRSVFGVTALLVAAAACSSSQQTDEGSVVDGGQAQPGGAVASIALALTVVPADVLCLHVVVAGNQTVSRVFDVTPGQGATVS